MADKTERRLAAIVAMDVVGYSRLMGVDEVATLGALRSRRAEIIDPTIKEFGGRIVKTTGDGLLVELPSVVSAVECAVRVQASMQIADADTSADKRLVLRIGINLGDVIIEGDDIFGDGVNIAARLEQIATPGGVCVSQAAFDQVRDKLEHRFVDMGEQSLKNIARPIRAYSLTEDDQQIDNAEARIEIPAANISTSKYRSTNYIYGLIASLLFAIIGIASFLLVANDSPNKTVLEESFTVLNDSSVVSTVPQHSDELSIAVLAFDNLSTNAEQEYFADGIAEDIITDLSKISQITVIARNSSFFYKDKSMAVSAIGEELGVRYVLEGSVRRAGSKVRINAQLIDVSTEAHLWAERYDGSLDDVFAIQDEVTGLIVSALALHLNSKEQEQITKTKTKTPSFDAYDTLLRAREVQSRFTLEDNAAGRVLFQKAARLDPTYARAYAGVALTHAIDINFNWSTDKEASIRLGLVAVEQARQLDTNISQLHLAHGSLLLAQGLHEEALAVFQTGMALSVNNADGHAQYAFGLVNAGLHEQGLEQIAQAKRLNPHFSTVYLYVESIGLFHQERYKEVVDLLEPAVLRNPAYDRIHLMLAASYAELGLIEDADWSIQEAIVVSPDISLKDEIQDSVLKRQEDIDRYVSALRVAGLPE